MSANLTTILPTYADLWQSSLAWTPDALQQQQFQILYSRLVEINQQVNLTRITTPEDFWEKHLWDSLYGVAPWLTGKLTWKGADIERVIDVGTGGGFPGLPVAIAQPTWTLTLLDATRKKIQAVQTLAESLDLRDIDFIADRAEIIGQHPLHRAGYDLALVRAVGPASTCAEYALPLLKMQGIAVLYRGQWTDADSQNLLSALEKLGGELVATRQTQTPITGAERTCLYIQKTIVTESQYPRDNGVPAKLPL
ncbi:MAG: 16S rRNA (guanine(527)-N(7))-methyltransferase RsmG [Cyanobacteria bacterium J06627_15]